METLTGLISNAALLLILGALYYLSPIKAQFRSRWLRVLTGLIIGAIGIVLMMTPWELREGLFFDTRSILLVVSGIFFGPLPTVIAALILIIVRALQGGLGMVVGIGVITSSTLLGLIWRRYFPMRKGWIDFFFIGLVVHVVMLGWMLILPGVVATETLRIIAFPTLVIYPTITALLAKLLEHQRYNFDAHAEAARNERRLKRLLAKSWGIVSVLNREGKLQYVSESINHLLGYNPDSLLGSSLIQKVHPDDKEEAKRIFENLVEHPHTVRSHTFRLRNSDGEYLWFEHLARNLLDDEDISGIVLNSRDISERMRHGEESRNWHQMIQEVISSSPTSIAILDNDLKFIYVSQSWLSDFDMAEEDLIGNHHYDVFPDIPQRWRDVHQRALNGESLKADEDVFVRADGVVIVARWACQPWHTESGEIGGIVIYTEHITEQKKAQDILQAVIQTSIEGFWVSDQNNRFVQVNQSLCDMLGYSEREMLTMSLDQIVASDSAEEIERNRQRIQEKGSARFKSVHRRKDGKLLDVEISATYLNIEGGRYFVFVHDISEETQANRQLAEERERMANIIEGTGVGTWEWNIQTGEVIFNDRWAEMIGYTLDELRPLSIETWLQLVHPDDQPYSEELLNEHFAGKTEQYSCEVRMKHKNGRWVWILDQGKLFERDAEGKPLRMAGTHLDMTKRRETESQLSKLANEQAILLRAARTISESLNQEAVLQTLTDSSTELLKIETAAIYLVDGQSLYLGSTTPPLPPDVPEELRRSKTDEHPHIKQVIESCEPLAVADPDHEEWSETERSIIESRNLKSILYVPILDQSGVMGVMITGTLNATRHFSQGEIDLCMTIAHQLALGINNARMHTSLLHHAEELQQEITERTQIAKAFRDMAENSPLGIVIADETGRFIFVNKAFSQLTGYSEEELAEKTGWDLTKPEEIEPLKARMRERMEKTSGIQRYERTLVHRDGHELITEFTATTTHWNGKIRPLAIVRDITEQRKSEAEKEKLQLQLAQAMKMESIGRLAGGIAHDFNNMLAVIISATELSLPTLDPESDTYHLLKEIDKAANRSANLTRQLLAFSRKQLVQPIVVDLNEVVQEQEKMLSRLIGEDITITLNLQEDPWHVLIDPSQIDQILANLSVNARDAIEGVGTLLIETKNVHLSEEYSRHDMTIQEGDFALLSITDSGCGMDEDTLDHVFEPFYTTKEVGEGTGLGLATVYGIVKQNNGVIHVYSEVGMGTTFKIYLPRYTGQLPKRKEREESEETSGQETILIVEDEAAILNLTKRYLEQSGYTVLAASNPMEAIGIAHDFEGQIDLLLSDVVMPGMDGKALETKLRKIKPGIKTMFMSGYSANVIEQRGILDEGIEFIEKPFTMRALTSHIRRLLEE